MSTQPTPINQPKREYLVRERYRPAQENHVREQAKSDRITGSVTLEYAQGTVVAITVQVKVPNSPGSA